MSIARRELLNCFPCAQSDPFHDLTFQRFNVAHHSITVLAQVNPPPNTTIKT